MAIALTNSYQKVAEVKMGSWGYGTLYLRTYARFNADNNIDVQGRIYNNGTYCWAGNCYATVQGQTVKSNVRLDFTSKAEIILGTKTVEGGTINAIVTFKCYAFDGALFTAKETVTLPTDIAMGLDFDIGSATTITITRRNENYTRSVVASIGTYNYTLFEKGTSEIETIVFPADKLYEQVTDSNVGEITLTTTTYDGDNVVGTETSKLKCRVTNSNPVIDSVSITDVTPSLSVSAIIRYITKPTFEINARGINYATIVKYSVTELNSEALTSTTNVITSPNAVSNNEFSVTVTDSRGNTNTSVVKADNFVPYTLPVISKVELARTGENLDKVQVNIGGSWFNDLFISTQNVMLLKYRYKSGTGDYSQYETLTTTSQASTFDVSFELFETFDVNTVYTIEVAIDDYLRTGTLSSIVGKAIALIDHWNENDIDYYNINAIIQQHGNNVFQEDTGWIKATLSSSFIPYQSEQENTPIYRKIGKLVEIKGVVSPKTAQDAGWGATIFTLPEAYRPSFAINKLCQGSGSNKWLLAVNLDGTVTFARYSGTSNVTIPATAWLHFQIMYFVD